MFLTFLQALTKYSFRDLKTKKKKHKIYRCIKHTFHLKITGLKFFYYGFLTAFHIAEFHDYSPSSCISVSFNY